MRKDKLSFAQIWNMCFGFFGVQIGFALQNANTSRIFQTLGADIDKLPILWIAAPLTGLLVQPLVGHFSDRTWGRLGRRRPYVLAGAVCTTLALLVMPNSPALWVAAAMLWLMDASINVTMEPFRAFVGDLLPDEQRTQGFAMQSFFIGVGAVFASALPWLLTTVLGVANTAGPGEIPLSVKIAFGIGAALLFGSVGWTVLTTKEHPPETLAALEPEGAVVRPRSLAANLTGGVVCILAGLGIALLVAVLGLQKEVYVLAGLVAGFGFAQIGAGLLRGRVGGGGVLTEIVDDLFAMPKVMRSLALVQFFTWFALFAMWIYATSAVTSFHYGATDPASRLYNEGADWVGVLFAIYSGVAAVAAIGLPLLAARVGRTVAHALSLSLGGLVLFSFLVIRDPHLLWVGMIGVGVAWASILSAPYSILSGALSLRKMGVYMGIFNIFIVVPQLLAATVLGAVVKGLLGGQPIYALGVGGGAFFIAAILSLLVDDAADPVRRHRRAARTPA